MNPSLCVYAIYSVLHRILFLSLVSSTSCFHRLTVANCEMPRQNESTETVGEPSNEVTGQSVSITWQSQISSTNVWSLQDYLSTQLDVKG